MAPLVPQQVEQLVWLGLSAQTIAVLQPYITILPAPHQRQRQYGERGSALR